MNIQLLLLLFFLLGYLCLCQCKNAPPTIIEQPQDQIAELDKPMAIHCRAESFSLDDLTIDWYKDGRLVTMDPHARIITEFMALHVINAMPQDAGVYYCIAKNSHGQTQSRKARIQFMKLDKEFIVSPTSTMASIGERVHFRCQPPVGLPTPTVYWTKDGKNVSLSFNQNDLILSSIQRSDFGSYRCIATNGLIRQSAPAYLTEFYRPKISISPSTSRIDLRRGQSIELKCEIDNEQYELEWHHNNKIIRNQTIDIPSIDFDDSGVYQCVARFDRYLFHEDLLLAIYDREIRNHQEKIFSQTNQTVFLGQSSIIECQLPFHSDKIILWNIQNQEFLDANHYRLKISRIRTTHHDLLLECWYDNSTQGLIRLNVKRRSSPPIISYIPNNQTVPIGVETIISCQSNDELTVQWWFLPTNRPARVIRLENNRKYRIKSNHDLIIRNADRTDVGNYKCISINQRNEQTIYIGYLNVEDARSNRVFHRIENTDRLPQAPTQPIADQITSDSIELTWSNPSNDIREYLIEYFQVNSNETYLQWQRIYINNADIRQKIENLKPNSIYQFIVRAKNSIGFGLPSTLSDLIETRAQEILDTNLIYLLNPVEYNETSVTIQWNLQSNLSSIQQIHILIRNKQNHFQRTQTIADISSTNYTIENLRPNTDYMIYVSCSIDSIHYSSNKISVRTLESLPSSAPRNIQLQLVTKTSLSIQWDSVLANETNGQILAYKINCLSMNESNSIYLDDISADAKGLFVKNLMENIEYCITMAAKTQAGFGPYSAPICIVMNEKFLSLNHNRFTYRLHEAISQPWFLPVIILLGILLTCIISYGLWMCFHYFIQQQRRHKIKFHNSNSTSNQSVELPIQKTLNNGKRYDLIKDTPPPLPPPPLPSPLSAAWMNSATRFQCCTTASIGSNSEHYTMNIHKNPINALLQESRQQQLNPYATTGIFQSIDSETNHSTQYQQPWLDHQPSPTSYACQQCASQSHPHTPTSIRTTLRSLSAQRTMNELKKSTFESSVPIVKQASSELSQVQSSNLLMINSVGGETFTTSCSNFTDDNSSSDKHTPKTANQSSSEGSIFSDGDVSQQDDCQHSPFVLFERGPTFLMPN